MATLERSYYCDGACTQGLRTLKVHQISEHRLAAKGCLEIAYRFMRDEYITPGEMHILNQTADDAHDIMHALIMAVASNELQQRGIIDHENPYEYKYPDFGEGA